MTYPVEGLGLRIRTARRERGLSATELSHRVSRSLHTLYVWERGEVIPSVEDILRLADVLRVDERYLLRGRAMDQRCVTCGAEVVCRSSEAVA